MSASFHRFSEEIRQTAAQWVLRQDRGLTAGEQDAFSQWLAADPLHREALAEHRWGWEEMDRLIGIQTTVHALPDPDLLAPLPRRRPSLLWWGALGGMAAALAFAAISFWGAPRGQPEAAAGSALFAPIEQRTLADGSVVSLNRGASVEVQFTSGERRVLLVQGEANFQVAKNAQRPFVVSAGGVKVRAVGTAFNVRLGRAAVEVMVTEGKVQVAAPAGPAPHAPDATRLPVLEAGQSTVVPLQPHDAAPRVVTLSASEMETRLAWQPRLLDFTDTPLRDIVVEFNRRNAIRLRLGDAALQDVRLSATIRSDNVEGFVRLMESDFGMKADWRADEIVLRKQD